METPADIVNRAFDAIGADVTLGDLEEEGKPAQAALRVYVPTMLQLLRAAHWDFARREAPLLLLNDASGQTLLAGTGTPGMGVWQYEYGWPVDAVKARFLQDRPQNFSVNNGIPIMTNMVTQTNYGRMRPCRFIVAQDIVPNVVGSIVSWSDLPDFDNVQGQALDRQAVVLTNARNPSLVYTGYVPYPGQWDPLFQQAMVSALGERLALAVLPDKKFALAVRREQMMAARAALEAARVASANEGWSQADISVDWMQVRSGGARLTGRDYGSVWYGHDAYSFSDGSVY